jgi:hypothetical protein
MNMGIDSYVGQILSSPVYIFDGIIEKLIAKNIHNAKIELSRYRIELDAVLIESIKSILNDLKEEEGFMSRFLYSKFGIEFRKNKRREQLLYLGSEMKSQHSKIKNKLHIFKRQQERISFSIGDLSRLKEGFSEKSMFFENEKNKNKSKFFMNEIEGKIKELQDLQLTIHMRYNDLADIEKVYNNLFMKIPRYHELGEDTHLLLLGYTK